MDQNTPSVPPWAVWHHEMDINERVTAVSSRGEVANLGSVATQDEAEQAVSEQHPMVGRVLTSTDPQPPSGTTVRDDCGTVWVNDGHYPVCWVQPGAEVHDPESWAKIAGNYGPVTVLEWGDERFDQVMRQVAGQS